MKLTRLTPAGDDYFFGYYDVPAVSSDGQAVLAHRVGFRDRLPTAADSAEIGWLATDGSRLFHKFEETRAWNFQLGSMLRWLGDGRRVVWNDAFPDRPAHAIVRDLVSGNSVRVERAIATVSSDHAWALTMNFERLFDFRPGYGYCQARDRFFHDPAPENDGIFRVNLHNGVTESLVISLAEVDAAMREHGYNTREKVVLNCVTLSPDNARAFVLARNIPAREGVRYVSFAFLLDLATKELRLIGRPGTLFSHYFWESADILMAYYEGLEGRHLYRLNVHTGEEEIVDAQFFLSDIHMTLTPDRQWLLCDRCPGPDREGRHHLFLYHLPTRRGVKLGTVNALKMPLWDIRCDIHPRWSPGDGLFTFDSTHEGYRGVYQGDVREEQAALLAG